MSIHGIGEEPEPTEAKKIERPDEPVHKQISFLKVGDGYKPFVPEKRGPRKEWEIPDTLLFRSEAPGGHKVYRSPGVRINLLRPKNA